MTYKHIIWDWNGTLLDDAGLCVEIMNGMLLRRGIEPLTDARYAAIFDFPVKDYYQRAGWDFNKYPFEELSDEFIKHYDRRRLECSLRKEALEILQEISLPQSILTASKQSAIDEMMIHFNTSHLFTGVRGLDNHHAAGKIEIGRQWVKQLKTAPKDILMVGDTVHDYEVAQAIGIDCVLIPSGHQSPLRLQSAGATVVSSLSEIHFS